MDVRAHETEADPYDNLWAVAYVVAAVAFTGVLMVATTTVNDLQLAMPLITP